MCWCICVLWFVKCMEIRFIMYGDKIYDVIFTYMPYIAYIFMCFYCHTKQIIRKRFVICFIVLLYMHSFAYILMYFIVYLLLIYYTWVKGELLWSFTLIHAYIISWVLSSSKRGRLLAQRPIALVLMMINSWSYIY